VKVVVVAVEDVVWFVKVLPQRMRAPRAPESYELTTSNVDTSSKGLIFDCYSFNKETRRRRPPFARCGSDCIRNKPKNESKEAQATNERENQKATTARQKESREV
jgi:hypothetical protein